MSAPIEPGPRTVADCFARAARERADAPWLEVLPETAAIYGIDARTWSYGEAAREVERLRTRYAEAGFGPGLRAGLLLHNRPEFLLHWFALNGLGVSVVPINGDWRASELEYVVGHSEIAIAVAVPERRADLAAAARAAGRSLVIAAPDGTDVEPAPHVTAREAPTPDVATECALLYTSGTTGRAKGCILSNEYFLAAGEWYATIGGLCAVRPGAERLLTPLPLSHMNAMAYSTLCMLTSRGCLILLDRFHPASWWDSVRASHATIVHYLGVMPAMLMGADPDPLDRDHSVRFGFGAGVSPRLHAAFESRFGFPLLEAWAMTETGAGAVIIANREPRHVGTACFGRAGPAIECRIVDETGAEVAADVPGELLVRQAGAAPRRGFFAGYLKDSVATREAWEGGWFHTGDLVTRDAQGMFRFLDRRRNLIRRSGENISAVEVEGVLVQHPLVAAVGVCAVPDALRGDEVFAAVVPRGSMPDDPASSARELVRFCLERLAYFKAPGHLAFCERLPLTPTEKIQRSELKALGARLFAAGECIDLRDLKRRGT